MDEPGKGMRGEICWRRAGVRAGLGTYGESGALVTKEYGQAVRLSGVVTTANLIPDTPVKEDVCDHCMRCVEACPVSALKGNAWYPGLQREKILDAAAGDRWKKRKLF